VFGGWEFEEADVLRPDFARTGYANGVPMGGDLVDAPTGTPPTFMVRALRDPDGANLDRIQIVKGWFDTNGALREQVYDIVCSDERAVGAEGRCEHDVGTTVDVPAATYTNSIGDALLMGFWQDPDFDPAERAVYIRQGPGDPDAALDDIRCGVLQHRPAGWRTPDASGARVHVAYLVHAGQLTMGGASAIKCC
jgi:hypothetical protein